MNVKPILLAALIGLAAMTPGMTQQDSGELLKIGLLPFKYANSAYTSVAGMAESQFYEQLINSRRVAVLERAFFQDLEDEKWRQSQEDFIDGNTISRTKSEGAKYVLLALVVSCSFDEIRSESNGSTSYYCNLTVNVRIVDAETSQVKNSRTLKNPARNLINPASWITHASRGAAERAAVNDLKKPIKDFLNEFFPLQAGIIEISERTGTKAKTVLVEMGEEHGVKKGDVFAVLHKQERTVGGKNVSYTTEVGEIAITEVNSPEISTAAVRKGNDQILSLMDQGATLIAKSKK